MSQWLRYAIAEEQGDIICPLRFGTYTICDENCEKCEDYIDFMEALKEREEEER